MPFRVFFNFVAPISGPKNLKMDEKNPQMPILKVLLCDRYFICISCEILLRTLRCAELIKSIPKNHRKSFNTFWTV